MASSDLKKTLVDINALVEHSGLSESTIWRLKRDGKIPFYQPAGKHGRVMFPEDAIELCHATTDATNTRQIENTASDERLPGPQPGWMSRSKK